MKSELINDENLKRLQLIAHKEILSFKEALGDEKEYIYNL